MARIRKRRSWTRAQTFRKIATCILRPRNRHRACQPYFSFGRVCWTHNIRSALRFISDTYRDELLCPAGLCFRPLLQRICRAAPIAWRAFRESGLYYRRAMRRLYSPGKGSVPYICVCGHGKQAAALPRTQSGGWKSVRLKDEKKHSLYRQGARTILQLFQSTEMGRTG